MSAWPAVVSSLQATIRRLERRQQGGNHDPPARKARAEPAQRGQGRGRDRRGDCRHRRVRAGGACRHDLEARLCQPADRTARRVRRSRQFRDLEFPQHRARRAQDRQRQLSGRGRRQGQPVQSQPRRRRCARTDRVEQDRPDAGGLDAGDHQPGRDHVRGRRDALHLDGRAVAALFHRPPAEPRQSRLLEAVQLDLPFLLGARGRDRGLHQHVGTTLRPTNRSAGCSPTTATAMPGATSRSASRRCSTSSATSSPIPAATRT